MTADLYQLANEIQAMSAEMAWGLPEWLRRQDEWTWDGRRSSPLDGSGGGSDVSRPTELTVIDQRVADNEHQPIAVAIANNDRHRDPAQRSRRDLVRAFTKVHAELTELHRQYVAEVEPRLAPPGMGKPSCEVCTTDNHRCEVAWTTEVTKRVKGREVKSRVRVCRWCGTFKQQVGRLPNAEEAAAHAEGRTVKVRKVAT